jgi:hypothetical protein
VRGGSTSGPTSLVEPLQGRCSDLTQKKRGGCVREDTLPTKGTNKFTPPGVQNNVNFSQVNGGYASPVSPWRGKGSLSQRSINLNARFILAYACPVPAPRRPWGG